MMIGPAVSVVVPVYNVEKYLRACVDSILMQTFREFELILVDDGSPDGCGEICDRYARSDNRVIVIHQRNGGLSSARNAGMRVATGKYLYFVDSDDTIVSNALELCINLCERHELDQLLFSARVVCNDGDDKNAEQRMRCQAYYDIPSDVCGKVITGLEFFNIQASRHKFVVTTQLRFFRRESIPAALTFPVGLIHEDHFFSPLSIIVAKRVMAIPDQLYVRMLRDGSIMSSSTSREKHADSCYRIYKLLGRNIAGIDGHSLSGSAWDVYRMDMFNFFLMYGGRQSRLDKYLDHINEHGKLAFLWERILSATRRRHTGHE